MKDTATFTLSVDEQVAIARQIFPDLEPVNDSGAWCATCPGQHLHTTRNSRRDFFIWFERGKGPHENCMHASCAAAREDAMRQLWSLLRQADPATRAARTRYANDRAAYLAAPTLRRAPFEPFDAHLADRAADGCPQRITDDWLRQHSPVPIPADATKWPTLLLNSIFRRGEKILVFTKFASQGQLLHTAGGATLRLEEHPPAYGHTYPPRRPSGFPRGGQNGVWFLAAPITGEWTPNENAITRQGAPLGRRHAKCCTRFPYLVLESDVCHPSVWLRILVQLADPIVAIYTSGGKSYHALVRIDAATKEEFDRQRINYCARLAALGADHAAVTAVRLTRLPGCLRFGSGEGKDHRPYLGRDGKPEPRMQQLLYLNPTADGTPILNICTK